MKGSRRTEHARSAPRPAQKPVRVPSIRPPAPVVPRTLVAFAACALAFLVLWTAFSSLMHAEWLYPETTIAAPEHAEIMAFLDGPLFVIIPLPAFTAAESSHMADVKIRMDAARVVALLCAGVLLGVIGVFAFHRQWDRLDELTSRAFRAAGIVLIAVCALIGFAALIGFTGFWTLFHRVLFPGGNWAFPATSTLITLYPAEFFFRFVIAWAGVVVASAVAFVGMGVVMDRMRAHAALFDQRAKK
jgi:integral membrane protein (TIGR01906 family)